MPGPVQKRRFDPLLLVRGLPGHPLHPPLTDATIGMFVLAAGLAIVGKAGGIELAAAKGMWLALIGGLIVAVPTATTGMVDWLSIQWGSPRWRTATLHLTAMVSAVALFALAAWRQYHGYQRGHVTTGGLILTLCGAAVLTLGGWLGGSLVFVHGTRVLTAPSNEQPSEPVRSSAPPEVATDNAPRLLSETVSSCGRSVVAQQLKTEVSLPDPLAVAS